MRRAQALAAPPRGLGRLIPTAPLSPAGTRPAAASAFRPPAPPPSRLSQARFESGDTPPELDEEELQLETELRDKWSRLESRGFAYRPFPKHRWTQSDPRNKAAREARDAAAAHLRVREKTQAPKPPPEPRPDIENYLFSDHVLDLGAEGAPGVRLYDEADRDFWNEKWSGPSPTDAAARERLLNHVGSANDAAKTYESVKYNKELRYQRIRHLDILSLALRGGPVPPPTAPTSQPVDEATRRATASLLHRNGIPSATWGDDATILWWMEGRTDPYAPPQVKIPDHNDPNFAMRNGRFDYGEFRRILSIALASGKGFVSPTLHLQKQVASVCRDGPNKPAELDSCCSTLAFIMDVHHAIRMGNDILRIPLIRLALENAAGGLYVDIAHDYLALAQEVISATIDDADKPDTQRLVGKGVSRGLSRLAIALDTAAAAPDSRAGFPTRASLMRLLTGFGIDWIEAPSCFWRFMAYKPIRDPSLHWYVGILARLGALRSVWLLWRAMTWTHWGGGVEHGPHLMDVFSRALINAKDAIRRYYVKDSTAPSSPGDASQMDCMSMPKDITKPEQRSAVADTRKVELPAELPLQITAALELEKPEEAIRELKRVIVGDYGQLEEDEQFEEAEEEKEEQGKVIEGVEKSDAVESWKALQAASERQHKQKK